VIRGFAFDLEGTVVNVERAHHEGHILVARDVGVDLSLEVALEKIPSFIGGPDDAIAQEIFNLGNKSLSPEEILRRDKCYYQKLLSKIEIKPRPGFVEVLEYIKRLGLPVAIGSLTERREASLLLEKSGVRDLFPASHIVLREDVTNVKPAPDVFLETARKMGINPYEQLVFDDSPKGIKAAIAAGSIPNGMPVYRRTKTILELLEAGAKRIFFDWRDINIEGLLKSIADDEGYVHAGKD
jgi:beta-phosphoglucomutase